MTVLMPKDPQQSGNKAPEAAITRHEVVAMAGTILCTALSVGIMVSRLLGYQF